MGKYIRKEVVANSEKLLGVNEARAKVNASGVARKKGLFSA